jgi:hypothetical protein
MATASRVSVNGRSGSIVAVPMTLNQPGPGGADGSTFSTSRPVALLGPEGWRTVTGAAETPDGKLTARATIGPVRPVKST